MRMPRRLRVLGWLFDRTLAADVATLTPAQLARARAAAPSSGPLAAITGRTDPRVTVTAGSVAGDGGARLDATFFRPGGAAPEGGRPLAVHLHGGGWTVGNHATPGWLCGGVAVRTGALVVSVGYRLAPEHRFPTGLLDCLAAVRDLVAGAERLGIDPGRVAVFGDSAGGNLSAAVSLLARDGGGPPIAAQALSYPAIDATLGSPSVHRLARSPIFTLADLRGYLAHYLGPDGDPTDPRASPLLAPSHAGLPPTLVQTAEHDLLVDDGRRYADALAAAGVRVRHTCYQGMPHGFLSFPGIAGSAAHQARAEIGAFLAAAFAGSAAL